MLRDKEKVVTDPKYIVDKLNAYFTDKINIIRTTKKARHGENNG